jgi:hypothetical protein
MSWIPVLATVLAYEGEWGMVIVEVGGEGDSGGGEIQRRFF